MVCVEPIESVDEAVELERERVRRVVMLPIEGGEMMIG